MEVIEVDNHSKLPRERMECFICMSPDQAAHHFRERYQQEVKQIYKVIKPSGRFTLYIPVTED